MNLYLRLIVLLATHFLPWLPTRPARRRPVDMWGTVDTRMRVIPMDLDVLAHMNNGRYLSILDLGRMDLLLRTGLWRELVRRNWYPVVGTQTVSYRRSLTLGQRFDLLTRVMGVEEGSAYIEQSFLVGSQVYAQAIVRVRFLRRGGGVVEDADLRALLDAPGGEIPHAAKIPAWVLEWARQARAHQPQGTEAA